MVDAIETEGVVREQAHGVFHVAVEIGGVERIVIAKLCGRMAVRHIRVMAGDRVRIELSPYDTARGRIVYRL